MTDLDLLIDKYIQERDSAISYVRYEVLKIIVDDLIRLKEKLNG